jgi:3-dehydroquinate synthase
MHDKTLRLSLADRSYDIVVTSDDAAGVGPFARERTKGRLAVVVSDDNAQPHAESVCQALCDAGFKALGYGFPPGETHKSLVRAGDLYNQLVDVGADRQTLIVAVGGGVIGDLAGFVAATFARGLSLLMVPTTLLAMVDSSVGGKVGVNHEKAKNLIGAFHQPIGVWIDTGTLVTLPEREYRSGLAEVVKYGVILDPELFEYLEEHVEEILNREPAAVRHIVARSCQLKAGIVEKDERETTGLRVILNFGHTFAHAFETVAGYGHWLHGEAVAAGMVCASRLAAKRGMVPAALAERLAKLLRRFHLPTLPEPGWSSGQLLKTMARDKKSQAGQLRFVLPTRLGEVRLVDGVSAEEVLRVLTCTEAET